MADCMTFPDTVEEFMEQYKIVDTEHVYTNGTEFVPIYRIKQWFEHLPPAQSERLTDDDFETIRIHLNAYKEKLCNQRRWKEAEEYQRIIDRFIAFASVRLEQKKGEWIKNDNGTYSCSVCQSWIPEEQRHYARYCLYCGADMRD